LVIDLFYNYYIKLVYKVKYYIIFIYIAHKLINELYGKKTVL
jgi:hypothetical protein